MSRYDYEASRALRGQPFYALIMAAMYGADSYNIVKLREAWPDVWAELDARYHAPGGVLESEIADAFTPPDPFGHSVKA